MLVNEIGDTDCVSGDSLRMDCIDLRWNSAWISWLPIGDDDGRVVDERSVTINAEHLSTHHVKTACCVGRASWVGKALNGFDQFSLVRIPGIESDDFH